MTALNSITAAEAAKQASIAKVALAIQEHSDLLRSLDLSIADVGGETNRKTEASLTRMTSKIIASQSETNWLGVALAWFVWIDKRPDAKDPAPVDPTGTYELVDPRVPQPPKTLRTVVGPQTKFDHPYEWLAPGDTNADGYRTAYNGMPIEKEVRPSGFGDMHFWVERP